jgi:hypothetical protein
MEVVENSESQRERIRRRESKIPNLRESGYGDWSSRVEVTIADC